MNRFHRRLASAFFALGLGLAAGGLATVHAADKNGKCADCGRVQQIKTSEKSDWKKYAAPAAGAVVGGVVGNQLGGGRGRTALTVAGAAGGAYAGHKVEEKHRDTVYEVVVAMDDGTSRTVTYESTPPVHKGDRVRLRDGKLVLVQ